MISYFMLHHYLLWVRLVSMLGSHGLVQTMVNGLNIACDNNFDGCLACITFFYYLGFGIMDSGCQFFKDD